MTLKKQNKSVYLSVYNTSSAQINQESLAHVFDRFYRADESRNSETGDHGIGLSIAKNIVSAHNGKIQALSQDGRSFRIDVFLPI